MSDLFGDESYFGDTNEAFWSLQNTAIAETKERYEANGWAEVIILDAGEYWRSPGSIAKPPKSKGGKVYVQIANDGEITFHESYITQKTSTSGWRRFQMVR